MMQEQNIKRFPNYAESIPRNFESEKRFFAQSPKGGDLTLSIYKFFASAFK